MTAESTELQTSVVEMEINEDNKDIKDENEIIIQGKESINEEDANANKYESKQENKQSMEDSNHNINTETDMNETKSITDDQETVQETTTPEAESKPLIENDHNKSITDGKQTKVQQLSNILDENDNNINRYESKNNESTTDDKQTKVRVQPLGNILNENEKESKILENKSTTFTTVNDEKSNRVGSEKFLQQQLYKSRGMSTIHDLRKLTLLQAAPKPVQDYIFSPVKSVFFSDIEWEKFLYEDKNRESMPQVIELIGEYAEGEAYFDIYQICAFDSINDRKAYKSSFFQAVLCLMLQLPSIIFIVYGEWTGSDKTACNNLNEDGKDFSVIVSKCLAFGYSLYVSFYIEDMFANKQRGMRCVHLKDLNNKPDFINGMWLRIGGYYNSFASYCATIASFMIIFYAESQIDLVLNALALFFLIEIDDLLVTRFDYWKIKTFIDDLPMRNKIGFRVIDIDGDSGVKITNSNQNRPAALTEPAIYDGDIIIGIQASENDEINPIQTKQNFTEYYEKKIQNSNSVIFNIKRKIKKKQFEEFNVKVTIMSNNDNDNERKKESGNDNGCKCTFWKGYQYYFDFPLKTIILFVRFIAPFYVGICS